MVWAGDNVGVPRRNRSRSGRPAGPDDTAPPRLAGMRRVESHPDGDWIVQQVTGSGGGRSYLCPGCRQQVPASVPHIVAWPQDVPVGAGAAVESRRHWHTPCWRARDRRR